MRLAGKPVHIYFSEMPLPHDVDPAELAELQGFKEDCRTKGLYGSFASEDDLRTKVRSAVEFDLGKMQLGEASASGRLLRHAILRAQYITRTENINRSFVTFHNLVVENRGDVTAEGVHVEIAAVGGGSAPDLELEVDPNILPDSEFKFPLTVWAEISNVWEVTMTWREGETPMTLTQHVSSFN